MNKFLISGIAFAAVCLSACDDKDVMSSDEGTPLSPGSEISFGAGLASKPASRTSYGDKNNDYYTLHWIDSPEDETLLDQIYIFSPDAQPDYNHAHYRVKPSGNTKKAPAVKVDADKYISADGWGEHRFYGVYPSQYVYTDKHNIVKKDDDAVADGAAGTRSALEVPARMLQVQEVVYKGKTENGALVAEPDMKNCPMTASKSLIPTTAGVDLVFDPLATVLDITLTGPPSEMTGETKESYNVTSVILRAEGGNINGGYWYNFETGAIELDAIGILAEEEPASETAVLLYTQNEDGTKTPGVRLTQEQKLNLMAFTLPDESVTKLTVEVYSDEYKFWSVDLNPDANGKVLERGQIHKVLLGNLTQAGARDNYSSWMTTLDDNIRIVNMSIPGSASSFTYKLEDGNPDKYQNIDIEGQFDAGIRVFRANVKLFPGSSAVKSGFPNLTITGVPSGNNDQHVGVTVNGEDEVLSLGEAVHHLHTEMQARGNREFCILALSDYFMPTGESISYREYDDFFSVLSQTLKHMNEAGLTPAMGTIDANTTLGQVRGKILTAFALNAELGLCEGELHDRHKAWNPYYNAFSNGGDIRGGMLGTWAAFERLISRPGHTIYGNKQVFTTGESTVWSSGAGLAKWESMNNVPCLFTWWTRSSMVRPNLSPVTYGTLGEYDVYLEDQNHTAALTLTEDETYTYEGTLTNAANMMPVNGTNVSSLKDIVVIKTPGIASWCAKVTEMNLKRLVRQYKDENYILDNGAPNYTTGIYALPLYRQKDDEGKLISENYYTAYITHSTVDRATLVFGSTREAYAADKGNYEAFWPMGVETPNTVWYLSYEPSLKKGDTDNMTPISALREMWDDISGMLTVQLGDKKKNLIANTFLASPEYGSYNTKQAVSKSLTSEVMGFWGSYDDVTGELSLSKVSSIPLGFVFMGFVPSIMENINTSTDEGMVKAYDRAIVRAMIEHNNKFIGQ